MVLGCIQNESRRFYVYVANKDQIIRSISDPSQWKYVETIHNPADIATRGTPAKQLVASPWFNGPEFLRNDYSFPTTNDHDVSFMSDDPEVRPEVSTYSSEAQRIKSLGSGRFNRFSRWSTLCRALANFIVKAKRVKARRQGENLSTPNTRRTRSNPPNFPTSKHSLTNPSAKELNQAQNLMMKTAQADAFTPEIRIIQQSKSLKKPRLHSRDPFIDNNGVLRVGGRLRQPEQLFEEKHPAIFPRDCHLANLAIDHFHESVHHKGRQITYGKIRQVRIWIIGANRMISKRIKRCVTCRRLRGKLLTHHMANLPRERLETPPPFTNVGFDVFRP